MNVRFPIPSFVAVLALAGCGSGQPLLRITASPATLTPQGLAGAFVVQRSPTGIASTGTGGACLVYSEQANGRADCSVDTDCTLDPEFTGGYAYCLHPPGGHGKAGRCWVRPAGNGYCLRSPTTPYARDTRITMPVDANGNPQPVATPIPGWWRVHACLAGHVATACGDPSNHDKQVSNGPPRRVP